MKGECKNLNCEMQESALKCILLSCFSRYKYDRTYFPERLLLLCKSFLHLIENIL